MGKDEKDEYPDCPEKSEDVSKEDYQKSVKEYFKLKGLKYFGDFSDAEKETLIKEGTIDMIGPKVLSQKYNTMVTIIRCIVKATGLNLTPDDVSKYPDYPKISDDMPLDVYRTVMKKYWNEYRKGKKKEYRADKVLKILTTQNPEDLTNHPDFPEFRDGESYNDYADRIEQYWAKIIDRNSGRSDRSSVRNDRNIARNDGNSEKKSQTSKRKRPDQPDKNEK